MTLSIFCSREQVVHRFLDEVDCEHFKADKEVLLVSIVICACAKRSQSGGCFEGESRSKQFIPQAIMK